MREIRTAEVSIDEVEARVVGVGAATCDKRDTLQVCRWLESLPDNNYGEEYVCTGCPVLRGVIEAWCTRPVQFIDEKKHLYLIEEVWMMAATEGHWSPEPMSSTVGEHDQ